MSLEPLLRHISENQTAGFILVLARVSPMFLLAPIFSSRMVPLRARGIAAVAISIGLAPLALHGLKVPMGVESLGGLVLKELLVGFAYAFAVSIVFNAITNGPGYEELFVADLDSGRVRQLTHSGGYNPSWSPEGSQVAFDWPSNGPCGSPACSRIS